MQCTGFLSTLLLYTAAFSIVCEGLVGTAQQHDLSSNRRATASPLGSSSSSSSSALYVNIHLKLDVDTERLAEGYDARVHVLAPHDDLNLSSVNQPHVTVYLTEFQGGSLAEIERAVEQQVLPRVGPCVLQLQHAFVQGFYGMWHVHVDRLVQFISDSVVNATYGYAVQNQTVPAWVYDLPEPERSRKIALVKKYGSPGVFDGFEPHVTLAFDSNRTENLTAAFVELNVQPARSHCAILGLGKVGRHGSIIRGDDYRQFVLGGRPSPDDSSSYDFAFVETIIVLAVCCVCCVLLVFGCAVWATMLVQRKVRKRRETKRGMVLIDHMQGYGGIESGPLNVTPGDAGEQPRGAEYGESHMLGWEEPGGGEI